MLFILKQNLNSGKSWGLIYFLHNIINVALLNYETIYFYNGKEIFQLECFSSETSSFHFLYFQLVTYCKYSTVQALYFNFLLWKNFIHTGRKQVSQMYFIDRHPTFNINQLMAILLHQYLCLLPYMHETADTQPFLTCKNSFI